MLAARSGREIIFEFEDLTGPCDHKHQASGHDPGKQLRHLTGVLNQTCAHPACRRPETHLTKPTIYPT